MMQMLQAGGISPLTDGRRQADNDNPKGYYEHEGVKQLKVDNSFLEQAQGNSLKVIHALLKDLPAKYQYEIIFLNRDLHEVIRSQRVMLERLGKPGASINEDALISIFARQVQETQQWIASQPNMRLLCLDHHEVITQPTVSAQAIASFLQRPMDIQSMSAAVDPTLYRHRKT
ncbi:MAG: sulfotransferase family protein [Phycisphaerales bacterium]|nr:sulfotransferase family protein [Phycisphaerales bacterium]